MWAGANLLSAFASGFAMLFGLRLLLAWPRGTALTA